MLMPSVASTKCCIPVKACAVHVPVGAGYTHIQTAAAGGGAGPANPALNGGEVFHVSTHGCHLSTSIHLISLRITALLNPLQSMVLSTLQAVTEHM